MRELDSISWNEDLLFPEAPRWRTDGLWFTDMLGHTVYGPGPDGAPREVARFDDIPGGIGFLPDGTLVVVGMHSGKVFAVRDGEPQVYVDLSDHVSGSLDDMVVAADGTLYVGNIGVIGSDHATRNGTLLRVDPDRRVSVDAEDLVIPNGAAITADGRTLVVAVTFREQVLAFPIAEDGSLGERRVFATLPGMHPDGLCLDAAGAAWVGCYAEGVYVRVEEGGTVTDRVSVPGEWATGVEVGGADGHTLFMTSAFTDSESWDAGRADGRIRTAHVDVPR